MRIHAGIKLLMEQDPLVLVTRRKIVKLFDRGTLEGLYNGNRPWLCDVVSLHNNIICHWPEDAIRYELEKLMKKAKP